MSQASTEIKASVIAKTGASILQLNAAMLERANQATQIRFLKVFAEIVVQRQTRAAPGLPQQ